MAITVNGSVTTRASVNGGVKQATTIIAKEIAFHNRFDFPQRGYSGYLYVATDEDRVYRWDNEKGYVPLSSEIDDTSVSLSSTWSSNKINSEFENISKITDEEIHDLFN